MFLESKVMGFHIEWINMFCINVKEYRFVHPPASKKTGSLKDLDNKRTLPWACIFLKSLLLPLDLVGVFLSQLSTSFCVSLVLPILAENIR